ncbi:MAG: phosphoribosylglycinamide formyltransferase [Syntrophomonadaceae bacterium]|nr:phosphoribosylglycinamide formyltransferase [Syntrophomonadaceae bacterium]
MIQIRPAGQLNLAVLASGRGSNFDAICQAIERNELDARIKLLLSDKLDAPALEKAKGRGIIAQAIDPYNFTDRNDYENELVRLMKQQQVDMVVLAGYMRLVGTVILENYPNRVLNIHPALLPSFPGLNAHKQALDYGVKFSGCTVHIVDSGMDSGPIICQAVVPVLDNDNEETLSQRILQQEHQIYWQSLQLFAEGRVYLDGRRIVIRADV